MEHDFKLLFVSYKKRDQIPPLVYMTNISHYNLMY